MKKLSYQYVSRKDSFWATGPVSQGRYFRMSFIPSLSKYLCYKIEILRTDLFSCEGVQIALVPLLCFYAYNLLMVTYMVFKVKNNKMSCFKMSWSNFFIYKNAKNFMRLNGRYLPIIQCEVHSWTLSNMESNKSSVAQMESFSGPMLNFEGSF